MTGKLEKELLSATGLKPPKGGFNDRQDELAALAKAAYKLKDDDFNELTDEAANWVNASIKALNAKSELAPPDEDEGEDESADAEAERDQPAEEPEDEEAEEADEEADDDAEAEADAEAQEASEAAEAAKPKPAKAAKAAGKPPAKAKGKSKKPPEEPEPLARGKILEGVKTRYDDVTGEKDRFGCIIGTDTQKAVVMYERGTTSKELKEKLGGRYYNILARLSKEGHLVERTGEGTFKLTHKDDIVEKPKKGGKK